MFETIRKKFKKVELPDVIDADAIDLSEEEIEVLKGKAESMDTKELQKFGEHYSEDGLWKKIKKFAKKIGSKAVYAVLLLYFVMQKEEVPKKNKMIILGALGYFILPLDFIPDVAAGVGYTDDIGVLLAALWQVAMYIDDDVKSKAKAQLKKWFGEEVDTSDVDDRLA